MKCKKCNQVCFEKNIDNKAVSNCCSSEIDYTDYSQDQMQGCWHNYPTSGSVTGYPRGMSLRDYFAAKASEADIAQQLMLHSEFDGCERDPIITRQEARYYHADAMLEAREK